MAVKTRSLATDHVSDVDLPRPSLARRRYLSVEQVRALAGASGEQAVIVLVLAVQRMLGHAKSSMTRDTYSDLFDADLAAVAGQAERGASGSCGQFADSMPRQRGLGFLKR